MLNRCPECDYDLRGLPPDHTCPECGLKYDSDCFLTAAAIPKAYWVGLGVYIVVGAWVINALVLGLPNDNLTLIYKLFWVFFFMYFGVRSLRKILNRHRGLLVAVLPQYLLIFPADGDSLRIAWSDISRAAANPGTKTVTIFLERTRTVRDIRDVFPSGADCQAFAAAINRRLQRRELWFPIFAHTMPPVLLRSPLK